MLLVVTVACENLPGRPTEAERPINPIDVTDFDALWGKHCAGCHGADGRLAAARPLNDPLYLAVVGDGVMRGVIAHGVPGTAMPGFLSDDGLGLDAKQLDLLLAGMRQRWAKKDALTGLEPATLPGALPGQRGGGRGGLRARLLVLPWYGRGGRQRGFLGGRPGFPRSGERPIPCVRR